MLIIVGFCCFAIILLWELNRIEKRMARLQYDKKQLDELVAFLEWDADNKEIENETQGV